MVKKYLASLIIVLCVLRSTAQLNVTPNNIATQLARIISGPGVSIYNATTNCHDSADGTFSGISNLGLDSGIILTTGYAQNAMGPNDSVASQDWIENPGDPDIANAIGLTTFDLYDPCVLEFDLQVLGDSLKFKYVFGSEEYPDWVCSEFNDAFGFFISGPGITGVKNIALVPGTTVPVAINNINGGPGQFSSGLCPPTTYPQYFIDNGTSDSLGYDNFTAPNDSLPFYIQYNGFTTVLTASIGGLQACQIYHLKLAIDDVFDGNLDSGVFIEAGSLSSNSAKVDSPYTSDPPIKVAVRGCLDGIIPIQFSNPVSTTTIIHFHIGGTAINGTDYTAITADSAIFNPGDTIKNIVIHPIGTSGNDTETVKLYLYTLCDTTPYDSATLYILDSLKIDVTPHNSVICPGNSVQLSVTGGAAYTWTPSAGLSSATSANPIATPPSTTHYTCTTTVGSCSATDTALVTVIPITFTVDAGPNDTSCSPVVLSPTVTGTPIAGFPFVYSWTPANGLSNPNILNPSANPSSPTTYVLQVSSGNCSTKDSLRVVIDSVNLTVSPLTSTLCPGDSEIITATPSVTGGTYSWNPGGYTTSSIKVSPSGTTNYQVVYTSPACGPITATATVTVNSGPVTVSVNNAASCSGQLATLTASTSINGGTYNWSPGGYTTGSIHIAPGGNTTYTVTYTTTCGTATASGLVTVENSPIESLTQIGSHCAGGTGSINVIAIGGTGPYQYSVNSGAYQSSDTFNNLPSGLYTVYTKDAVGCIANDTVTVIEGSPVNVNINPSVNPLCYGDSSIICATTGFVNYSWSTGDTGTCIYATESGNYYVTATDHNNCSASSNKVAINVLLPFPVTVSVSGDTLTSYPEATYQWYLNGVAIPGATSQTYIGSTNGTYTLIVTDTAGCSARSNEIIVTTGIAGVESDKVDVYPNPLITGGWHLVVGTELIGSEVEIMDNNSRIVYKGIIKTTQTNIDVAVARSVYVLRITWQNNSILKKLIKL